MENKVYAVKRKDQWWVVIDCGKTKKSSWVTANFWNNHFQKDGKTYQWYRKLITQESLIEWQEIKFNAHTILLPLQKKPKN